VPVKRAQDDAKAGKGRIEFVSPPEAAAAAATDREVEVKGTDTAFTRELAVGDKIRPPGTASALKVKRIDGDDVLVVEAGNLPADFAFPAEGVSVTYDILKHTPLHVVFGRVLERLSAGGAVGIFPEGGSHDRTDLLPLKVGVALIAYSALEKDGTNVPIIPVGLNYYGAHRWRGRAVVEYGRPIYIEPSTLTDYKAGGAKVGAGLISSVAAFARRLTLWFCYLPAATGGVQRAA
jgi:glycerol-3-phosphate O-acyltransferase/dihydroxyacetone phosphate acyltransferase